MPPTKAKAPKERRERKERGDRGDRGEPRQPEAPPGDAPGDGERVLKTRHLLKQPDTEAAAVTDEDSA